MFQDKKAGQGSSSGSSVSTSTSSSLPPVCIAGVNGHMALPTSSHSYPVRPQLPIPSKLGVDQCFSQLRFQTGCLLLIYKTACTGSVFVPTVVVGVVVVCGVNLHNN